MNAAKDSQYLPCPSNLVTDINTVLNDTKLINEIATYNNSVREVTSRVKRLTRRKQIAIKT